MLSDDFLCKGIGQTNRKSQTFMTVKIQMFSDGILVCLGAIVMFTMYTSVESYWCVDLLELGCFSFFSASLENKEHQCYILWCVCVLLLQDMRRDKEKRQEVNK